VKPPKILVIDDDIKIQKLLTVGLESYGYRVTSASNGNQGLAVAAQQNPDVIILDVNLGSEPDGVDVCLKLREWTTIPIIVLSIWDEQRIKIAALNAGADDYLLKPFDMGELEARIRAVQRRQTIQETGTSGAEIRVHDLVIDLAKHHVTLNGDDIHLTPKEYELLRLLATNAGKVMTHSLLLEKVWGRQKSNADHYIRVFINTLRRKLGDTLTGPNRYIFTESGIGYRFTDIAPPHN
jgi:two-component system, OmpR family, KDP operon response regulator KdpE